MNTTGIEGGYQASEIESRWRLAWEDAHLSSAPASPDPDRTYCITIPPPNVTGSLHMGHALCYSIQDLLGRFHKMQGYDVLILPGLDHAGIATQSVVDKQLKKEGSSAFALGREEFLKRVWQWREESGGTILSQFRQLGCSFDWSRERFTLDEKYAQAVLKVFIDWFERGLIYKGLRVVNWDPVLKTSVSDIETERKVVKGKLYHIRYPFADGSGDVIIATTRPETMLADVAVAVHPRDDRYKGKVGKTITLPLVGRQIPLLADIYPDPEFGTGAVKITPGHDANDFEVGARHNLETLVILDETGKVNFEGPYYGLDRAEARRRIVEDLEAQGFLVKIEDHEVALVVSQRSGEAVEPMASEQWFVRQSELAGPALKASQADQMAFVPERYKEEFEDWLANIKDWCISRQLWWGHRIPVYYTADGKAVAALNQAEAEAKAGAPIVRQDDDVLDTWFSSGLWPFATLGWPEETPELKAYYPSNVLVTSRDILYLWVARMAMMGMDFLKERPFRDVFIYATILTKDGKRMSKSLGTGVDPVDVINTKGADALRFALMGQTGHNQSIRYDEAKVAECAHFCNKIWNAARFVLMNAEGATPRLAENLPTVDRWILTRLARCAATVTESIRTYNLQVGAEALENFFWSEYADWYIEVSKPRLADPAQRDEVLGVLMHVFEVFLKLLHPFMPFITEELTQRMPFANRQDFLVQAAWPDASVMKVDEAAEATVERWIALVRSVRALRAEASLPAMRTLPALYVEADLEGGEEFVRSQAWFTELRRGRPEGAFLTTTSGNADAHLPIEGLIDPVAERERISKEDAKLAEELDRLEARLANPQFAERAKPEVVARERARVEEIQGLRAKLAARMAIFS